MKGWKDIKAVRFEFEFTSQSVWTAHCHYWDLNPCSTRQEALSGQYHHAIEPSCLTGEISHNPTVRPGYCEYDSIHKLHCADVVPLPDEGALQASPLHPTCLGVSVSS